ncbi:MAG: PAS domain S-box protein [Nitrospirota bacterium]|nr:PAS domain S-box protein [Nitrospirota bacterium]
MLPSIPSLSAKIWFALLTVFLLLSLNTAASLLGSYRLTQLQERVERVHTELLGIERIHSTTVEAETGQRGYLLTGEERYLEPYRQALSRVDREREQLQSLLADDPVQQPRLQQMNQHIVGILAELRDTIELRKTKGFEAAIAVVTADRGKRLMDQMRALLIEMEQEEQDLLAKMQAKAAMHNRIMISTFVLASCLAGLGLIAASYRIPRTLRERQLTEERFRSMVEAAQTGMVMVDQTGTIEMVNKLAEQQFGYPREELLGRKIEMLLPERYRTQHGDQRSRFFHAPTARTMGAGLDLSGLRRDGTEFPVEIGLNPIQTEEGVQVLASIVDITERRQSERAIRHSEERYRRLVEVSPDAIFVSRGDRIVFINDQGVKLFGANSPDDIVGKSPLELIHPDDHAAVRARVRQLVEGCETVPLIEEKIVRLDGRVVFVETSAARFIGHEGAETQVVLRDISERKRADQTLQKERDFIDAVLETAGALVVVLDREGRILRFNRACEQATGYSSEEVLGRHVWDLFVIPDEVDRVKAMFERLRGGEPRNDYENYWKGKDGLLRRISWTNTVLTDPNGKVDYIVAAGLDITDFKHIQEQLRKTERIAELGTLASGMAHEIGTPMNVILGRAEYLFQRVTDEGTKKGLATIVTQVERITKVMNQLLAFARRKTPERRAVDLGQTIDDSLEMFHERMAHSRITVEKAIETNVPSVHADRDQLIQVLINLVMNSIHAMPEGGRLRLSLARESSHVCLGVSDTGQGMPEEIRSKVFDPFFTTKDFGKGTGLGLTVVKGIIEEHGGTIAVESAVDMGTTFWIRLPLDGARTADIS